MASVGTLVAAYATPLNRVKFRSNEEFGVPVIYDRDIDPFLTTRYFQKSAWHDLVKRGTWPDGMGDVKRSI